jgi:hypothetical protein
MCIEFLRALAKRPAPVTLTHRRDVDNLLVLRAAGLVAAFTLKTDDGRREVGRFLALTPDGRNALGMNGEDTGHGGQPMLQLHQ